MLPDPSAEFVKTPYVQELTARALSYLEVAYAVHFTGPAGTGKTTLAFHVAAQLGRPVMLIHGDGEFGSSHLVRRHSGYRKPRPIDNFIHSVLETEESMNLTWMNNRLTTACKEGFTLIYDEFPRSRPEANHALLSILEEKILNPPKMSRGGEGYLEIHPDFRAIFTSNPAEYAGVPKSQDALLDRLITIELGHFDRESEIRIAMAKSGIPRVDAATIVDVVRESRGYGVNHHWPTVRVCIAIAKILAHKGARARLDNPVFIWTCRDVLNLDTAKVTRDGQSLTGKKVEEAIRAVCTSRAAKRAQE